MTPATFTRIPPPQFRSFWMGGFECSTHRRRDGLRLDLLHATQHDRFARQDYERLRSVELQTARDGVRWHRIETRPGHYDWSGVVPMLRAARESRVQIIWDLLHYGWPDDVDVWSPAFIERFARFCGAWARLHREETGFAPLVCPVNEPSFLAWAYGEVAYFQPGHEGRGSELKRQLARAAIAASHAILEATPRATLIHIDPLIRVLPHPLRAWQRDEVEGYERSQWDALDAVLGRHWPELGGHENLVQMVGLNYYIHNQRVMDGDVLSPDHPEHLPLRALLQRAYDRIGRPLFIAETGIEDEARPLWLRYIGNEARAALRAGVPLQGACLYPVVNHPGWDDDRHCHNGLWDYADGQGHRDAHPPLAEELRRQVTLTNALLQGESILDEAVSLSDLAAATHRMDATAAVRE